MLRVFQTALALLTPAFVSVARADNSYVSTDKNLTFSFPRRWKVEASGEKIQLTASDGVVYLLKTDALDTYTGNIPSTDPDLKTKAIKLIQPLLSNPVFIGASSLTMDHGFGVVYKFRPTGNAEGAITSLYVAFIGKHSLVALPEKAGQSSEAIGMSSIFQSVAFVDSLPKAPIARPNPTGRARTNAPSAAPISFPKTGTISYATQIAPIMKERCESCHNSRSALGGLSVSKFADFVKGGKHSDDIVAGRPESSLLMDYLTGKRTLMPKGGESLSSDKIELIRKWIAEGARETPDSPVSMEPAMSPAEPGAGDATPPAANGRKGKKKNANQNVGVDQTKAANGLGNLPLPDLARRGMRNRNNDGNADNIVLEAHSGHLVANDLAFVVKLIGNKTASAHWEISPGREYEYSGTYVGEDGNYLISLNLVGVSEGSPAKSIALSLRGRGGVENGYYGFNGNLASRSVAEISLSEVHGASKARQATQRPATRKNNRKLN